jgi:antitoxin component YwqK of YwqJK toxin-antitoxin module
MRLAILYIYLLSFGLAKGQVVSIWDDQLTLLEQNHKLINNDLTVVLEDMELESFLVFISGDSLESSKIKFTLNPIEHGLSPFKLTDTTDFGIEPRYNVNEGYFSPFDTLVGSWVIIKKLGNKLIIKERKSISRDGTIKHLSYYNNGILESSIDYFDAHRIGVTLFFRKNGKVENIYKYNNEGKLLAYYSFYRSGKRQWVVLINENEINKYNRFGAKVNGELLL